MNGTTSVPKFVPRFVLDNNFDFACVGGGGREINLKHSGLKHRHLVHGMDASILTSLLRPMFTVT